LLLALNPNSKGRLYMREFNVTGLCVPSEHYMADIGEKIAEIMKMVEKGKYFSINRARQYGKTTTLFLLNKVLPAEYTVISISFEGPGDVMFEDESSFCNMLLRLCTVDLNRQKHPDSDLWNDDSVTNIFLLGQFITKACQDKKIVLMIDEIDKMSNSYVFLRFLGMLREKYLLRQAGRDYSFHSVILAGVHDIKNLKNKMIQAGTHELQDGEKRMLSPWNIATKFNIDMSLNEKEIASMLTEYEKDHKTGMDIETISKEIRAYTNGYPYLVSVICLTIEDELKRNWTANGVHEAIKLMLLEKTTLIDDIAKNLTNNQELREMMFNIIALGEQYTYDPVDTIMDLGLTFGFLIKQNDNVAVGNKFFEILLYRHFINKMKKENKAPRDLPSEVIHNNKFNMQLTIEKFTRHYYEMYRDKQKKFIENECRMLFLTYLAPLINGGGFCHVESETRNAKRMDLIVDYNTEQFIVELKLWYGETAHEKALDQIVDYLNSKNKNTGYLLTFDFRKKENTGEPRGEWVEWGGKRIFDMMVGV
jgi:hypothetical protein